MAVVRKKSDDKYLKALRELITTGGGNRQCFDCGQKGPTYVNMTIGSFVCTRCSGVLRGLTPPHRVKSISMASFTQDEIDFLKAHGNDVCAKTWLGLWDPKRAIHQDHRELMIDKYERKRYYLEPASPLKSLTLIHNQNGNNNNSLTNGYGNIKNSNSNHDINQHHQQQHQQQQKQKHNDNNNLQQIHLTPPNSHRSTSSSSSAALTNGIHHHKTSANSSLTNGTSISRPNTHNSTNSNSSGNNNQNSHNQDLFGLKLLNGNGLKPPSSISSASTGALSDTSSCTSNGFGPDSDFVADFNSANIYDATSLNSALAGGSSAVNSATSVVSSNGYAKIQPIKMEQKNFMNGGIGKVNGIKPESNGNVNGFSSSSTTENFADFDHAPIYNAVGFPIPNGIRKNSTASSANINNNVLPGEDRYAALKDLDEQLRESKAIAEAAASIVSSAVVDSFGNLNNNNIKGNTANPFKHQQQGVAAAANGLLANPFQAVQQQHQQQNNTQQTTNLFGQMTVIPNSIGMVNGYAPQQQQQQQQSHQQQQPQSFFNYSNGFAATTNGNTATMFVPLTGVSPAPAPNMMGGPNGCGFGFGSIQQQIAATGGVGVGVNGGGAFNNPFAATGGLNSNNPFL